MVLKKKFWMLFCIGMFVAFLLTAPIWESRTAIAQTPAAEGSKPAEGNATAPGTPAKRPFSELITGLKKQEGLFTVYTDLEEEKAYLAILPNQFNRNFLFLATLENGIGEAGLFRGWPINDVMFQFREARGDRVQIVVPNTFIRNGDRPTWQNRLLNTSFSDSSLYALNIVSEDPSTGAVLIDLANLIKERDLANTTQALSQVLSSYVPSPELSYLDELKVFPQNIEIGRTVALVGGGVPADPFMGLFGPSFEGLADPRGFSLRLRYSLSEIPTNNGYRPRLADQRVGYFISAYRAPIQAGRTDPFVRYIHRWHLEKQDPDAELSPPKEPIVFWLENTVPPQYRDTLREGALLWNRAFEQAGFKDAIEVRQMPDNADWDPADVRYNVIRWSDSLRPGPIGYGPSRVNPLTGEILDADIILDANVIAWLQRQYQTSVEDAAAPEAAFYLQLCGRRSQTWYLQWLALQKFGEAALNPTLWEASGIGRTVSHTLTEDHCAGYQASQQTAFGALALTLLPQTDVTNNRLDEYIQQYLLGLTAHEVGHTLGLRHNFAGSRFLSPEELHQPQITRTQGLVSSVMDYYPPNLAPPGTPQGDFFPTRLGAYDQWAIEYGYREIPATPLRRNERAVLEEVARQASLPELTYATDEDIFDFIDPEVGAWDLSNDPMQFSLWQLENSQALWRRLNRLSVSPGEGYGGLRRRFNIVFGYFEGNALTIADYIGGQRFRRLDPWDLTSSAIPFEPIPVAKQREALQTISQQVFSPGAFEFSSDLLNQLAPDRWYQRGTFPIVYPLDYPIYDRILTTQSFILSELMYADRLARVRDTEFKAQGQDSLTLEELYTTLHDSIWTEVATPQDAPPTISSLRRGLQRHHLQTLASLVLRRSPQDLLSAQSFTDFIALVSTLGAPEDARVLARYQLRQLAQEVNATLSRHGDRLDLPTRAHLEDLRDRLAQILNASLIGL